MTTNDLPLQGLTFQDAEQELKIRTQGKSLRAVLPCLLAAERLFHRSNPKSFLALGEQKIKALLIFYFCQQPSNLPSDWFFFIVGRQSNWVAEMWLIYAIENLKKKGHPPYTAFLSEMRYEPKFKTIANIVFPKLLERFPVKIAESHCGDFIEVLLGAMQFCSKENFTRISNKRLSKKSISPLQRAYLLMTGFLINPVNFEPKLGVLLKQKQIVTEKLFEFIRCLRPSDYSSISPYASALLFKLFAPHCSPRQPEGVYSVTAEEDGREFLHHLINQLCQDINDEAQKSLSALALELNLGGWTYHLNNALEKQKKAKYEAQYSLPTPQAVATVLANSTPANH